MDIYRDPATGLLYQFAANVPAYLEKVAAVPEPEAEATPEATAEAEVEEKAAPEPANKARTAKRK